MSEEHPPELPDAQNQLLLPFLEIPAAMRKVGRKKGDGITKGRRKADAPETNGMSLAEYRKLDYAVRKNAWAPGIGSRGLYFPVENGKPMENGLYMPVMGKLGGRLWIQGEKVSFTHAKKGAATIGCKSVMLDKHDGLIAAVLEIHRRKNPHYRHELREEWEARMKDLAAKGKPTEAVRTAIPVSFTGTELAEVYMHRSRDQLNGDNYALVQSLLSEIQCFNFFSIGLDADGNPDPTKERNAMGTIAFHGRQKNPATGETEYAVHIVPEYMDLLWEKEKVSFSPACYFGLPAFGLERPLYKRLQFEAKGRTEAQPFTIPLWRLAADLHLSSLERSELWRIFGGRPATKTTKASEGVAAKLNDLYVYEGGSSCAKMKVKLQRQNGHENREAGKCDRLLCWCEKETGTLLETMLEELDRDLSETAKKWYAVGRSKTEYDAAVARKKAKGDKPSEVLGKLLDEAGFPMTPATSHTIALYEALAGSPAVIGVVRKLITDRRKNPASYQNPAAILFHRLGAPESPENVFKRK